MPEELEQFVATLAGVDGISTVRQSVVGIENFADSSITIGARFWVPTEQAYRLSYDANLAIFNALKAAQIEIPFPQREILIKN